MKKSTMELENGINAKKTHILVPNALAVLTEKFMQIKSISQLFKPFIC